MTQQSSDDTATAPMSPFSIPLFRTMWTAAMIASLGATIQSVGASWLMTTLSQSPLMVALVQASASLPIMLLGLAAGAIADNHDRRRVMLLAQGFMLAASILLAGLMIAGRLSPALLLVFTFLIGCGTAINWPAMQVAFADIVPPRCMPRAVALNGMGVNIARSIGPALGGAIIAAFGAATAFCLNALCYLGMIGALIRWDHRPEARLLPREGLGPAMAAGVRYAALSPLIGAILLRTALYGACASGLQALLALIARDLNGGALAFGFLFGAFGLGAVSGALISARLRERWSAEKIVGGATLLGGASCALVAASGLLAVTWTGLALAGASWLIVLSTLNVTIQLSSPRWVVARALSLFQTALFGGVAGGSWTSGLLAERWGAPAALYVSAAGLCVVALLGRYAPIRARTEVDLGPRTGWRTPETAVPVDLRSGPIVITLEYRVAPQDTLKFAALMQERSRILRRDGARRWSLGRDLADPELWIERCHVPTWLDYLFLNQRRTRDDLSLQPAINACLIGGAAPVVRLMIERQSGAPPWSRGPDFAMIEPTATSG